MLVRRILKKQVITPFDEPQEFLEQSMRERQVREIAQDTPLIRTLGLAHHWQPQRVSSMPEIAANEGIDLEQVSATRLLAQLACDLIEAIALGRIEIDISQLRQG